MALQRFSNILSVRLRISECQKRICLSGTQQWKENPMAFIRTDDDIQLNYRIDDFRDPWSDEPVDHILMHHGWAKSMKWWTPCVPVLARRYPVLRYDCRGCGGSSVPSPQYAWSLQRFVTDALNVLDGVGLEKVHWVGFESGGAFGLAFAAAHPDRVKSVTTMNTANSTWNRDGNMNNYFSLGDATVDAAVERLGLEEWVSRTIGIHVDLALADASLVKWVKAELLKTPLPVAKEWIGVYAAMDTSAIADSVRLPTLLMAGARQMFGCEPSQLQILARHLSDCRVEHLPNVGGGIQLVAPDAAVGALLHFLDDIALARRMPANHQ
jgi:3-oxoadipate enol-lactonase